MNAKYIIKKEAQKLSFLILLENHDENRHCPSREYTLHPPFHASLFSSDAKNKNARGGSITYLSEVNKKTDPCP